MFDYRTNRTIGFDWFLVRFPSIDYAESISPANIETKPTEIYGNLQSVLTYTNSPIHALWSLKLRIQQVRV